MRFTRLVEKQGDDGKKMYAFYEGDALACLYHEDDLNWEYKQIAFILNKACILPCFGYLSYEGKLLKLFGCNRQEVANLDIKLLNYQFTTRIPLDRQIMLRGYED